MMSKVVVFTGPTIPAYEASDILQAIYLDPVSQGDVHEALITYKPEIIAIIDGYFENVPSVWHKEILYAMSQGIHIFGSSSMGALRAAELHVFGMRGIGKIFNAYKEGIIEDDDEVAVFHGPKELGYPALSEAMVNIRQTCQDALDSKIISREFYSSFLQTAKNLYYKERTYHRILSSMDQNESWHDDKKHFSAWLSYGCRNLKKEDAVLLLHEIKALRDTVLPPKEIRYHFEQTSMWLQSMKGNGINAKYSK